ncbi:MAG: MFS transporter [Acidimicrobiales bacterium]|nr:MFS transporter [Acidimicrobiales bacterium]
MPDPATRTAATRDAVQDRLDASGRYQRWVLLTGLTGMFATTFPITLLAVSISTIAEDFDASETLVAWVISAPMLASAVALPILGKLGDLYGHRRIFLTGFAVATVVTALTTFAWDPYSLIVLRALAVVIGAATIPSSMALINSVHAPSERAKAMGWWSLVAAGAPAIGLVAGGPLIDAVGWRPTFAIQAILSVVPVLAAFLILRETPRRTDVGFDVPGSLTLAVGAGALMLALNQLPERGIDALVLVAVGVGAAGIAAFVWVESRVASPLVPLEFFRRRNFTFSVLTSLFAGAAYMGGFVLAPLLLQSVFAFSVSTTSLVMLARPASFAATSPLGGSIATKVGERPVAMLGSVAIAVALLLIGMSATTELVYLVVFALFLQGLGNGMGRPSTTAVLSNSVDESDLGIAAAAERMSWQVGSAMGITILTSLYGGTEQASDFFTAYAVGAGLGVAALVFATLMRSTPSEEPHPAAEPADLYPEQVPTTATN